MAERFTVDFEWLDTLIAAFDGSTQATDAALDALHETGPIRTGHKDLDKACDHFKGKWEKRVRDFRGAIGGFRGAVDQSRTAYGATERHVTGSMARLAGTVPPAGPVDAASLRPLLDPAGPPVPEPSRIREALG
ncbi:hypothetical protein [Streptomyces sp. SID3343]|uniref:hypothetical protein n=1 Tax=Streptomyces sp. SID3343 TaxID=2690260 RepID=UPI0013693B6B|nr:hypothetical protein [Streptomyces sp. SID3343]MYW04135.1 hypothetical protein [Streptomyces sp. SID3343]